MAVDESTGADDVIEDLEVTDEESSNVQGGFNPQPDPPGRSIA